MNMYATLLCGFQVVYLTLKFTVAQNVRRISREQNTGKKILKSNSDISLHFATLQTCSIAATPPLRGHNISKRQQQLKCTAPESHVCFL